jgi:hypothetical protein
MTKHETPSNVTEIFAGNVLVKDEVTPAVDPACVLLLETMLDKAKAGELSACAIAAIGPDGSTFTTFESGSEINADTLLGTTFRLLERIRTEWD